MNTRRMDLADLEMVLDWARDEGWNPGVTDAPAFHAADPEGFFLAHVDGKPAAAISVVNHDADHAFLGLYICRPEFRGQGHGLALWDTAMAHAGGRSVSLDGVPDQQANYARSGFVKTGKTIRYKGVAPSSGMSGARAASTSDIAGLIAADRQAVGHARPSFAADWFRTSASRQTVLLNDHSAPPAFATFRKCWDGIKIGPLHAHHPDQAIALLKARPEGFEEGPLYVDVPMHSKPLEDLLIAHGFETVFETARMVKGTAAAQAPPPYYSVACLELG